MYQLSHAQQKVNDKKVLKIPESMEVLIDGFRGFQQRRFPSSLSGVSFIRIAGQAAGLDHENSRDEVGKVLEKIKPGGVFMILGHGGIIPCGAVGAKKLQLELEAKGESLHEHGSVMKLLSAVPSSVEGKGSPEAERHNADIQARRILDDAVFGSVIAKKNITVVSAVFHGPTDFCVLNRDGWGEQKLYERHPKLVALKLQLAKGLEKVRSESLDLSRHYAHGIFLYDPVLMRAVLDPLEAYLDVGGISCVDARFQPNTPDGPKYLFRLAPNTAFSVTIGMGGGNVSFSYDDEGSITYALGHVNGVNSLSAHGEKGNGHIVVIDNDTSFPSAAAVKASLLELGQVREATMDGQTITLAAFDGRAMRLVNEAAGVDMVYTYNPAVNILSVV
ncbi:MAG: hypothetical protein V1827_01305 [Candidatus Micrarchaeota archaeon]